MSKSKLTKAFDAGLAKLASKEAADAASHKLEVSDKTSLYPDLLLEKQQTIDLLVNDKGRLVDENKELKQELQKERQLVRDTEKKLGTCQLANARNKNIKNQAPFGHCVLCIVAILTWSVVLILWQTGMVLNGDEIMTSHPLSWQANILAFVVPTVAILNLIGRASVIELVRQLRESKGDNA